VTKIYDESCNLVSGVALRKKRGNGADGGVAEIKCLLQLLLSISLFIIGVKNFNSNAAAKMQLLATINMEMSAGYSPQLFTTVSMGITIRRLQ